MGLPRQGGARADGQGRHAAGAPPLPAALPRRVLSRGFVLRRPQTRMLARGYGADVVYSEELIDHKLMRCERIVEDFAPPGDSSHRR